MSENFIITGASSGIGLEIAKILIQNNYQVLSLSRSKPPIPIDWMFCDLKHAHKIEPLAKSIINTYSPINGLVINAGLGHFQNLEELSSLQIDEMLFVNLVSHIHLVRYLLPTLKRQKQAHIFFVGSEAALQGKRKGSIYCASKFGLRGFAQSLSDECQKSNVKVTLLQPGMTRTSFYNELGFSPGNQCEHALLPEDVAKAVLLTLNLSHGCVLDEIILNPKTRVLQHKPKGGKS